MAGRMNELYEIVDGQPMDAVIRVIGVGGGGCNSVNEMVDAKIDGIELFAANTDRKHLEKCRTTNIVQLGASLTRGLGAGSNPEKGRAAALESKDIIRELLEGTDLLFLCAGMGGGTGTGAAPVIAEIAKEMGILTVAVVTKPYSFESGKRMEVARRGIEELQKHVDSLIVIPNEKLQLVMPEDMTVTECHKKADEVLMNAVQGISGLITNPGEINVDFADVQTVMSNRGMAMMGLGSASGEGRAERAVEAALACPLLDDIELNGARGILVTLTHGGSLTRKELQLVNERVSKIGSDDADMKFGVSIDASMGDELRVTVVATGLAMRPAAHVQPVMHASPKVSPFVRPESMVPTLTGVPQRTRAEPSVSSGGAAAAAKPMPSYMHALELNEDLLDIPTFLRQQAD
ncbi:MAG: ftsZ [Hydrocarboniphaga sp.]|uniref:cell division protein FtsZ n=1 Tax=Hydrocarboniphaga sp. TaxID=2033016 RepID=UPI00260BFD24|nr:cell division protein FtsZ [Hydrocarboniphaga sp.]MDB5969560.1 ftsZ [Hydrocarboniphaga sp.]